ncbi:MAG: hypothetical protein Q8J63_09450 [Candidatus Aquicultor sp.]|nr:hypothetical protein [Candidatus Aquicultor sp.]
MDESRIEEVKSEADEVSPRRNTKSQVLKYVGIWVAVVALFLVFNNVIKSVASNQAATSNNSAGSFSAGQPAAFEPGAGTVAGTGTGTGACGGECCDAPAAQASASGSQTGAQVASTDLAAIEKAAIDYYAEKTGDREVTAEAKSLGCHHEITIKKDGKAVTELSLRNGQFTSLRPW